VDHPFESAPATHIPPSFWRTAAVVAILVAIAELVLLVVTGSALLLRHGSSSGAATHRAAARPAASTPAKPVVHKRTAAVAPHLARSKVSVLVLNGNGRPGAAGAAAARVRKHVYAIRGVGNAGRMSYTRSIVMYRRGFEGEGRRLAHDLGVGLVGPLDGMRPAQLHGAQTVLILGA